jgi:hypothetical protein
MAWAREQAREAERRYRDSHRAELNARARERFAADPEKHRAAVKRSQAKYPDRQRVRVRRWRLVPHNRISFKLRKSLYQTLKHRDSGRDWRSDCSLGQLVGCSKPALVAHLESQFEPGMSWENYGRGGWEIDHIKPCADFDLIDPDQQRACFHFTNLRPFWQLANVRKSSGRA